jgi:uncharacterized protein (DUF58 family)
VIPALATRGRLVLAAGLAFVVVGGVHASPPLVGLGGAVIASLMTLYLWFYPSAILLRRRKIELSWWIPPGDQPGGALAVDRPFALHLALRNHGTRALRALAIEVHATSGLEIPVGLEATALPGRQVELVGSATARAAGYVVLHGAAIRFGDGLGLFEVAAFFPNPIAVKVFPRQAALRDRVGTHLLRRRGMSGELREIRDHAYGDPFKFVAWKATARRQKLMVRDLETEIVVTYQLVLDIGAGMRDGLPGATRLDYAIEAAAGLARALMDGGDRIGLTTFDSRVYSHVRPDDGYHHYLQLVDRLIELRSIVDEDLTDLTNGELVAAVARYLAHQEAVDVRVRRAPALDDAAWDRMHPGPQGELYDVGALMAIVSTLLEAHGQAAHKAAAPAWWWSRVKVTEHAQPHMAKLRLFCRLRGIELPYRRASPPGSRRDGLSAAVRAARAARADVAVVVSDLHDLFADPDSSLEVVALARRSGTRVIVVAPAHASFSPNAATEAGRRLVAAVSRAERQRIDTARALLARHGVPLVTAGRSETVGELARRLARAHAGRRRAA